jgi:uncharacterized RDD family membrane protein YckC
VSEVVTGEAVVLSVRVASLPTRTLALLIDLVVQAAGLILATVLLVSAQAVVDEALGAALYIFVTVLVVVGYPVILETTTRGRSLGKMALGLRVVSDDGGPERFRQALFRGLAGVIELWMTTGAVALVASLASSRGKRLGDVFAGTLVIGERGPKATPLPAMPPGLDAWAGSLELSGLSDEVANAARQYLARWPQLTPEIRNAMGVRIAVQMASCTTPPPPPNLAPYPYLAAVLAERRRRAEIRLTSPAEPPPPTASEVRDLDRPDPTSRGFSPPT